MIHFFCATPLQIYTSIILAETDFQKEEKTIYLIDYFHGYEDYLSRLENIHVFNKVKLLSLKTMYDRIKTRKNGIFLFVIWNIYYYLSSSRLLRALDIEVENGDSIFFSYLEPLCLMLARVNKKRKLHLHFMGYEDGIGAYTMPLDRKPGRFERFLTVAPYFNKECYWVYRPEYVIDSCEDSMLKRIRLDYDDKLKSDILSIWAEVNRIHIEDKYIFFDDTVSNDALNQIVDELDCLDDSIIVKKHPKRMDDFYELKGYNILAPQSIPFESYLIGNDMSDKVLINTFSSAVINSVFMFNQRPTIIFLYEILEDDAYKYRINEVRKLIEDVRIIYGECKYKIHVPKSFEEFRALLQIGTKCKN